MRLDEAGPSPTLLSGALRDGLESNSFSNPISFQAYTRTVLPIDGFLFWTPTIQKTFIGTLHYSQDIVMNEDETLAYASVVFTTKEPVPFFQEAPNNTIWVAEIDTFQFAFSQQAGFFQSQGLWHYLGHSIQAAMATQLLDRAGNPIDGKQRVLTNSTALWLGLNGYTSLYYDGFSETGIPFRLAPPILFPSHMVPTNQLPPYGTIFIPEDGSGTRALQATPWLDSDRSHYQLMADRVQITLYGLQNDACLDFLDTVNQYSVDTDNFGIMNVPAMRDGVRIQNEVQTRAMKKVIDFEVSYYQTRVNKVSRSLIKKASIVYIITDPFPIPPTPGNAPTADSTLVTADTTQFTADQT